MREEPEIEITHHNTPTNARYRDELNFAEFPLATLSDSVPEGQKTLVFYDSIVDRSQHARVDRKLTITASDEYGLPTAKDDEVILGLIQLTARKDFKERKVHFTRRDLIRELSWRDESKSYARIEESLKRWLGVTLYYENAWWSKEEQCWVDESFHILDQVTIFDRERIARRMRKLPGDPVAGMSSFLWNEVVFNSFSNGYLKQLDFTLYKSLQSHIAKRMYRFLDKRFHKRSQLEFGLEVFAFEKIGLSRKYHTGELKRRLSRGIKELEDAQFIEVLPGAERFRRQKRGTWTIVFSACEKKRTVESLSKMTDNPLIQSLVEAGVGDRVAESIVNSHSRDRIEEKLLLFGWLKSRSDRRISKNPAGFLVKAIKEDYPLPADYPRANTQAKMVAAPIGNEALLRTRSTKDLAQDHERTLRDAFWANLDSDEKDALLESALLASPKFLKDQYLDGKERGGPLFEAAKQAIIEREITKRMTPSKAA